MSIDRMFTQTITVQSLTADWSGAQTFADVGQNKGYIRDLRDSERAGIEKLSGITLRRVAMTKTVVPEYGQYLLIDGVRYRVKAVNPDRLGGMDFQIVDCEVVT